MQQIGSYLNVKGSDFYFSGCASCDKRCCDGRAGYALTPLITDDFADVYRHFPILFGSINDVFRPLMLMNDGNSTCSYLGANGECRIYEERPPACRLYPISPFFDEVFIDSHCPGVSADMIGEVIVQSGKVASKFYHQRLENFAKKLEQTALFMQALVENEHDFEAVGEVSGVVLYRYDGEKENDLIRMHKESLLHLE